MRDNPSPTQTPAEAFAAFASAQTFARTPAALYDPIRYAMAAKGKYVRPMLLLQAHALGSADPAPALPAAYAIELFHNFTLVHDDIMDAADTRRGRPSVHVAFDQATAILAGDAMLIQSYRYLLDHYDDARALRLVRVFGEMAARLCEGQQMDMDMEAATAEPASYEDYLEMIGGKTGVLITAALEMGGTIAGLDGTNLGRLREAGAAAGRAFQIMDDVLDTFSTGAVTGKMDYGDVRRGKQSAPFLRGVELANPRQRARLLEIYQMTPPQREPLVAEVLATLRDLGAEAALRHEVDQLTATALDAIDGLDAPATPKAELRDTITRLAGREF